MYIESDSIGLKSWHITPREFQLAGAVIFCHPDTWKMLLVVKFINRSYKGLSIQWISTNIRVGLRLFHRHSTGVAEI